MTNTQRIALERDIRGRMADYLDAMKSLDVNRVSDFYLDHPDFRVYGDGQVMDRNTLVEAVAGLGEALQSFDAEWEPIEVTPLGDNVALAAAAFTRIMTDTDGVVTRDWGTVTWVWVHDGGEWRLIHGQAVHYPGDRPST